MRGTDEEILEEAPDEESLGGLAEAFAEADLILDAVVGTGFKPPLRGVAAAVRDRVARLGVPVVAVDLPSGWDADSTEQEAPGAMRANAVVTFTSPKLAHVFGHMTAGETFGPVVVGEIGSPEEAIASEGGLTWTGAAKGLTEARRAMDSNKGMYGHVLLVAGSHGQDLARRRWRAWRGCGRGQGW